MSRLRLRLTRGVFCRAAIEKIVVHLTSIGGDEESWRIMASGA